jgi:N-acetylglucosamine-6-phosphate deacetylase
MSREVRTFLTGADLVLPDRIVTGQTLVLDEGRIVDLVTGPRVASEGAVRLDRTGFIIVPGFIDVHVHGVAGRDVLDGAGAIAAIAERLPRWGVTAFCPTTIACPPHALDACLREVAGLRERPNPEAARVLPAHLESNFINPEYRGAQPLACLRTPGTGGPDFGGADVLAVIEGRRADIGIVTLAPEVEGGLDLVRALVAAGVRVALGHSGATFDEAQAAIAAGARHATHLFNRMSPMAARMPGLAGAVLATDEVAAELVCDGVHVHPAVMRVAIAAKGPARMMAVTDGTAGSGLPAGSRARLGGQAITIGDVARLDDGTIAGSVSTMDRAFANLVVLAGLDLVAAATMCATTPARELGLHGYGLIAKGAVADFVVLDSRLAVAETWRSGRKIFPREAEAGQR